MPKKILQLLVTSSYYLHIFVQNQELLSLPFPRCHLLANIICCRSQFGSNLSNIWQQVWNWYLQSPASFWVFNISCQPILTPITQKSIRPLCWQTSTCSNPLTNYHPLPWLKLKTQLVLLLLVIVNFWTRIIHGQLSLYFLPNCPQPYSYLLSILDDIFILQRSR